jgi:hypothetical protein
MWATFDRQPLLFARYSSLQEGCGSDPQGLEVEATTGFLPTSRAVVGAQNGGELSKTSSQRKSASGPRVVDQQGSTEAYLGAYLGFTDRMLFLLAQRMG